MKFVDDLISLPIFAFDLFIRINYIKRVKIKYLNIIRANKFVFKV